MRHAIETVRSKWWLGAVFTAAMLLSPGTQIRSADALRNGDNCWDDDPTCDASNQSGGQTAPAPCAMFGIVGQWGCSQFGGAGSGTCYCHSAGACDDMSRSGECDYAPTEGTDDHGHHIGACGWKGH